MLPIACLIAWQDDEEELRIKVDLGKWWQVIISLCSGMRILHAHTITYREAVVGVQHLSIAAKALLELGLPLKPNWHMSMHYHQ